MTFESALAHAMTAHFESDIGGAHAIAAGVSGGPDSMALCFALSAWCAAHRPDITLHALTVDHGLRPDSTQEAQHVQEKLACLSNVSHHILTWDHAEKPASRIQERARTARYDLMRAYMQAHDIRHLFLGHHMDDQAETFLLRLSSGSGLDGLSCMAHRQGRAPDFIVCRPLLGMCKTDILSFCDAHNIAFIHDPSNESAAFARVRLRRSMDILAAEGLSSKRLGVTAMRLARRVRRWTRLRRTHTRPA